MTNYRQYRWRTVKAELDRKQATCELNAESCFAVEKKNNLICLLLHMSKQSSEEWGVAGGGGGRGVSILHSSPVCQLCRRLWAFVTTSACCQDSDWRMGGKTVTETQSDSASHVWFWREGRKTGQVLEEGEEKSVWGEGEGS